MVSKLLIKINLTLFRIRSFHSWEFDASLAHLLFSSNLQDGEEVLTEILVKTTHPYTLGYKPSDDMVNHRDECKIRAQKVAL